MTVAFFIGSWGFFVSVGSAGLAQVCVAWSWSNRPAPKRSLKGRRNPKWEKQSNVVLKQSARPNPLKQSVKPPSRLA
ncbi:hypothetical protein ALP35_200062 [Pseudomonas savastanoi pv. glycinea]|nr:hypothetical protein ALP35_200062 [Pseudomonas savastanoi pv. glycinea]